jgi:predicted signal transduction protein with EAL and GGDEF domain
MYEELFCHADQALYHAKNQGKDQFVFYEAVAPDLEAADHPGRLWTELGIKCE